MKKATKGKKVKLISYLKPYWIFCVLSPLLMAGEVLIDLFQPKLMSDIVNESISGKPFEVIMPTVIKTGLLMLGLVAYYQHREEHRDAAAEYADYDECGFGRAVFGQ